MEIDLMNLPYGSCESERESSQLKASKILTTLNFINIKSPIKYTEILVSMSVFNILETHSYFHSQKIQPSSLEEPFVVGKLAEYTCLLDFKLPPDELIFRLDTQNSREMAINSIFENETQIEKNLHLYLKDWN